MQRRSLITVGKLAGIDTSVKAAMRTVCKNDHRSREEIVDSMNELTHAAGIRITGGNAKQLSLPTLEKWLSPTAMDQVPSVRALVVFCEVMGDVSPLSALAEPLEARIINRDEARILRLAEIEEEIKELKKRKKMLEAAR
ncbi:hypothetical protein [uncultured Pseudodesulfovibrio sp.]|uniref:hypothetical protein n=1 Tax=uncultured Pseudodesulfovibrio sp. TaxID=2035858 RepID=UPI0029C85FF0|nr:hypothetical protein [uncultured Pseudodesulfovibrio sp.]